MILNISDYLRYVRLEFYKARSVYFYSILLKQKNGKMHKSMPH